MLHVNLFKRSKKVCIISFVDTDTEETYGTNEYKEIKQLLKEGHNVLAHFTFVNGKRERTTSPIVWITKNRFKTSRVGNVFRYKKAP